MLARAALWTAAAAMLASLVLGALNTFGVGLSAATPLPEDVSQRILYRFLSAEESFLLWKRWIALAEGIGFGALLVAVPAVVGGTRQRMVLTIGAALAVAASAMSLSKLAAFETARLGLDNGLGDTFAAANVFRFVMNVTAHYVWIGGLALLGIGFYLVARSAVVGFSRLLCTLMAIALPVAAIFNIINGDVALWVNATAFTVFVLAFLAWVVVVTPSRKAPALAT